jgi:hypothetical protein
MRALVEAEARRLSPHDRARLAAYRRGETTSIPGDEVFGELLKHG